MHMINQGRVDPRSSSISYPYVRKIRPKHGICSGMGFGLGDQQTRGGMNIIPATNLYSIDPDAPSIRTRRSII